MAHANSEYFSFSERERHFSAITERHRVIYVLKVNLGKNNDSRLRMYISGKI